MALPDAAAAQRDPAAARQAFVDGMLRDASGVFRVFTMHVGLRLGLYAVLRTAPATAPELAARAGIHPRYAREWLEQQCVAGVLAVDDEAAPAERRRYALPPAQAEVLLDRDSLDHLAPLVHLLVGATRPVEQVMRAYREGGGVPYAAYGAEVLEGQAGMNRAIFLQQLPREWLPAMPDVHARLQRGGRVADVGCGAGWSSLGLALAYPAVEVDGLDLDPASVELARANAASLGLERRVRFHVRDAAAPELRGRYDLVAMFEALHDLARPVDALRAMRGLAGDGGAVMVVDERVGERFTAAGEGLEWMMYGWSVLHCLPAGMAAQPSAGTGTVLRRPVLEGYAREAGFRAVEEVPVEHPFFRVWRLRP